MIVIIVKKSKMWRLISQRMSFAATVMYRNMQVNLEIKNISNDDMSMSFQ